MTCQRFKKNLVKGSIKLVTGREKKIESTKDFSSDPSQKRQSLLTVIHLTQFSFVFKIKSKNSD
jgi:hypothetical protein